jgi:hypothetical protein
MIFPIYRDVHAHNAHEEGQLLRSRLTIPLKHCPVIFEKTPDEVF